MSTTRLPELPAMPALDSQTERVEVWGLMQDYAHAYGLAVWKEAIEVAAQSAEERAAQVRAANMRGGKISAATKFVVDQLEFLASVLRSLPDPSVIQQGPK